MRHGEYSQYIRYTCVVGSTAYGLNSANSDLDMRGFFIPPTASVLSLGGVPEQIEDRETDQVYWELQKYLRLCLGANPNVLDTLYTDMVIQTSDIADELRRFRHMFLSKKAYHTYTGYAYSQLKLVTKKEGDSSEVDWKNAMHLTRLLIVGLHVLTDEVVLVDVGDNRSFLMSIRRGEQPLSIIHSFANEMYAKIDEAYKHTKLPDEPDYVKANEILIRARRMMW